MTYKTFVAQFFRDDTGASSATRLAFLTWSLGVFIIWVYVCILGKTLIPIPQTVVEMTLCFMGGKVVGSWVENNSPQPVIVPQQQLLPTPTNIPPGFQMPPST